MAFDLVRNAPVEVTPVTSRDGRGKPVVHARIEVAGKYVHDFSRHSRVSKHLELMDPKDLSDRLSGGSYFFIDGDLVDFRDGAYTGFVHTDESIQKFVDLIGYQRRGDLALHRRRRATADDDTANESVMLRNVWSKNEVSISQFVQGADFSTELSFVWNPFVKTIDSSFDLVRTICTNGMVGVTSFLNTKVPLLNRWEEHLDIASRQIQNKVSSTLETRVLSMVNERASVGDCLLLSKHAFDRLEAPRVMTGEDRDRLVRMLAAVSPEMNLSNVYNRRVFTNKALAKQLPSHLSNYDVWNIATELRTHTLPCAKSSDAGLDRFANGVLFDGSNAIQSASRFSGPRASVFSSPENAFWGVAN